MLLTFARWLAGAFPAVLERSPLVKKLVTAPGQLVNADALCWPRRFWPAGWYMAELKVSSAHAGNEAVLVAQSKSGEETGRFALPLANAELVKRLVYIPAGTVHLTVEFPGATEAFTVESLRLAWGRDGFARARVARRLSGIHPEWNHLGAGQIDKVLAQAGAGWVSKALPAYEETFQRTTAGAGYKKWLAQHPDLMNAIAGQTLEQLAVRPLISVVMPVYNPSLEHLAACLESIKQQSYPNWELCIADDASTVPGVKDVLERFAQSDNRIRVCYREVNGHICAASNSALALANGDYVALVDHDDLLAPHAFLHIAQAINDYPDAGIFYTDEDKIDAGGHFYDPHFKPDWNPELILAQNYVSHLGVFRKDLIDAVGGFREGFEGAQDHDLLLRCVLELADPARQVVHIPRVLYHWRSSEGSTALAGSEKSYAAQAGLKAVNDFLKTRSDGAEADAGRFPNTFRVRYPIPEPAPLVSLLVPTRNGVEILRPCVNAILERTDYRHFELLILDNQSDCLETLAYMDEVQRRDERVRVIRWDHPFNYSAINNFGARHAKGCILGLINNDIEPINSDWLSEMVSHAVRPEVGCVGAKLYYPNHKVQHGGVILGLGGVAGHSHKFADRDAPGYFYRLMLAQNLSAVTGACLLLRKEVFEEVGGLEEQHLKIAFNDVDLCLKVREAGYWNVWTPYAEAIHHESVSRGKEDTPEKQARFASEVAYMKKRWQHRLQNDPAYNPNLTLAFEDFSLR